MTDVNQFKLIIEDDEGRRSVVPVELGEVSIGRLEGNTIRLKERNVSRHHARLVRDDGGSVVAEDLDSYNGLWVNGDRVAGRHSLHDGDLLRIGDFQLELRGDGLLKRPEETTQRTVMGSDTQPGYHPAGQGPLEPLGAAPKTAAVSKTLFSAEPTLTDPDAPANPEGNEPTALIRQGNEEDLTARKTGQVSPPYAKLICVSTQYAGSEFELTQAENVIGRTDDNEVGIDHRSVSRQHAKVMVNGRRFRIVDMGSANGTLVNGEVYTQTELKRGDLIELGHVKLRFVPPGESYTLTPDEQTAARTGDGRLPAWLAWARQHVGVVITVVLVGVVVSVIATWLNLNAGNDKSAVLVPPPPGTGAGSTNDESRRLLVQAHQAIAQKQWKRAQSMGSAALELDPANDEAKTVVHTADTELQAQHSLDTAQQAMGQNSWADAFNALNEVPKDSSVGKQAQQLLLQAKANLATERVADCRNDLKAEDWDDAELLVEELQDLDPNRRELPELKAAIDDGRKRHPGKAGAHAAHPKKDPTKAKAVPVPLASHEPPPEDAKVLYADGVKALNDKTYPKAIDLFNRCMLADKNFSMCYRGMGIAYARSANGAKAVRYYKLYLKVDPNTREAPMVRQYIQQFEAATVPGAAPGP